MKRKGWLVYLLECSDKTYYCGITRDIEKRLAQHNGIISGGARYTRGRRPVHLLYAKSCDKKGDAIRMEIEIKKLPREKKPGFFLEK